MAETAGRSKHGAVAPPPPACNSPRAMAIVSTAAADLPVGRADVAAAAARATASASPLGTSPARRAATASADSSTRPEARAARAVTSFPDTSTIRARPAASRWLS